MSAETKKDAISDDIDLLLFLERILIFLRRYRWILLLSCALGLAGGLFMYNRLPTIYKSRMVVHSFMLTNQEHIQIISNWNSYIQKKEYEELSRMLDCPPGILSKVKKIEAEEIQKVFSVTNPNGFVVEVNVTDNAILDQLQKAIVFGLENSDYVKARLAARRATLNQLIEKASQEIVKLDSTKKAVEDIIQGKSRSSSSLIIEGAAINRQLLDMNEKLLSYKDELKFTSAVQVFQGFGKFRKPAGPHLIPWLIIGLLVFVPIGFFIAFILALSKKLERRFSSQRHAT